MIVGKHASILEVLKSHPYLDLVFKRHGLYCTDCIVGGVDCVVGADTIEGRAAWYGIEVDSLVEELNVAISAHQVASDASPKGAAY